MKNKIYKKMPAVSKNVYLNNLDEIVDKYNNIYHGTIKIKSAEVDSEPLFTKVLSIMTKIVNSKLVIIRETKIFLQRASC